MFFNKSFRHKNDLIYYVNCAESSCCDNYIGETGHRIKKRIKYHNSRASQTNSETQYWNFSYWC